MSDEDPLVAARRELHEEAGILVPLDALRHLATRITPRGVKVSAFRVDLPQRVAASSADDPDNEVETWQWVPVLFGLPGRIRSALHVPVYNVLLDALGFRYGRLPPVLKDEFLCKAEGPRDIIVCIPASRLAQVEDEEQEVARQVAAGHKAATYYWTVHALPKMQPCRVYFVWDGAVRAYHDCVGMISQPSPRLLLDHCIHAVRTEPVESFRGWRYYQAVSKSELLITS